VDIRIFDELDRRGHEGLWFASDPVTGMRAIIAIHSTVLGPALGGTRILPYRSTDEALIDVLRLSRGMTYKAAAAGLPLGGGKAVIIADPATAKTPELLRSYGRAVESLGGTYITAEDVGSTVPDMEIVASQTRHVTGLSIESGGSGDPSPATAHGVMAAMQAAAEFLWGSADLDGRSVAIQGVGKVGSELARLLAATGCRLTVADTNSKSVERVAAATGAQTVSIDAILYQECDLLAPCALGAVLDSTTIPRLRCTAVVGSANNMLLGPDDAGRLEAAGITYVPDFVANGGGIINIAEEFHPDGYSWDRAVVAVERIHDTALEILTSARTAGTNTLQAAEALAESRLSAAAPA
jgi:leucine dehydrogenase